MQTGYADIPSYLAANNLDITWSKLSDLTGKKTLDPRTQLVMIPEHNPKPGGKPILALMPWRVENSPALEDVVEYLSMAEKSIPLGYPSLIEWETLGDYIKGPQVDSRAYVLIITSLAEETPHHYPAVMPWQIQEEPTIEAVTCYLATVIRDFDLTYHAGDGFDMPLHIAGNASAVIQSRLEEHIDAMIRIAHTSVQSYQGATCGLWI